jgi:predicted O-methyltransferase YrrM
MKASIPRSALNEIFKLVENVHGYLTRRDIRFLATAAAFPTTEGSIVELGSFKGKSAIVIAKAARLSGPTHFATVDPMFGGIRPDLDRNLERAGVSRDVEIYEMLSRDFIELWDRPIRFLFHDGANDAEEVRRDVTALRWHYAEGAIIAFHDVLNTTGHRAAVFLDEVLNSDNFGPVGFCGSIGWGQYFSDRSICARYRPQRFRLRKRLHGLLPYLGAPLHGFDKIRYKLLRSCIPHHRVDSAKWLRSAA